MTIHFERGRLLLQQNRVSEAEEELRKELANNPANPFALALMAECKLDQKDYPQAIEFAEKAVGLQPNIPFLLYVLARVYFYGKKIRKAREAILEGLRLNPADPDFYHLRGTIEFYEQNWQRALEDAEAGLTHDAENVELINLRARALIQLNRQDEASSTLDYALNKAPENAYAHANKGWVAIEKDHYEEAVRHFKESLRLDPTNEFAREGLKEAIKGKNYLYRIVLKYFLWMNKLAERSQWYFIIGIYIFYQILVRIADSNPSVAGYLAPLIVAYILFAFSSWIAKPVSNLFLRLHPLAKHVLDDDEKLGSAIVGAMGLGAILSISAFYLLGYDLLYEEGSIIFPYGGEHLFLFGAFLGFMLIPVGGMFSSVSGTKGRKNLLIYVLGLAAVGLIGIFTHQVWAFNIFFIGILIFSFAANYIVAKGAKAL